jgi:hypothetical protein
MPSEDPHQPDALWCHENTIVVRAGELILDEEPISIRAGKKAYSASDGGFITCQLSPAKQSRPLRWVRWVKPGAVYFIKK